MKKYICLILALCLLMCTGCAPDVPQPSGGTYPPSCTEGTVTPDPSAPGLIQMPIASVSVPAVTQTAYAEDGAALFQYIYQSIALTMMDSDVANTVILEFLNRVDGTRAAAERLHANAQANYTGGEDWIPYLYRVIYDPMRIDQSILSFFGSIITYSGSSHPDHTYPSVNYSMVTGEVLTLPRILAVDDAADALCALIIDALTAIKAEKYLYSDYAAITQDRFRGDISGDTGWYFTPAGLCFYFIPYEIAPYSSGVVAVEIPYEKLTGILDDAFFPAEQETASGTVAVQPFTVSALEQFKRFPEVILEREGEQLLLFTQGTVYDLRLQVGEQDYDGKTFVPTYTVFAADCLTFGDALMVSADLPDDAPRLRICYRSGGEAVTQILTKSPGGNGYLLTQG